MNREELKGLIQTKPDHTAQDLASVIGAQMANLVSEQRKTTEGLTQAFASMSANQSKAIGSITANLTKQQDKTIATLICKQDELIKSKDNTAPKPTQPFFTSKQNDSDFANFKEWFAKFEYFTKNCHDPVNKLEWLKSFIKREASALIRNLSLDGANYAVAVKMLKY